MEDKSKPRARPVESVSSIVSQWGRERPDLDASPILIVGQLERLLQLFEPHLRAPFAAAELADGDFNVLAALRRTGEPYTLTPGDLSASLLVTSGAISKRVDRLEARALVRRTVSTEDARGRQVTLTATGKALTDRLIEAHVLNEARLLSGLSQAERRQLADLLARLADSISIT